VVVIHVQNGLLSSLPHMVSYLGAVMSGELADLLRRSKILSTTVTRKLFQCICTLASFDLLSFVRSCHSVFSQCNSKRSVGSPRSVCHVPALWQKD